jgi:hypothetical protein
LLFAIAPVLCAQEVTKIWDAAPHNAFTDLIRFRGHLYCAFREAPRHGVAPDGKVRVLRSEDGRNWTSAALLGSDLGDVRDPHFALTPRGELMLTAAIALNPGGAHRHQTYAWFTRDGVNWGEPAPIGEPDYWLWRVVWHHDKAYGVGYPTNPAGGAARLYESHDGRGFRALVEALPVDGSPNETGIAFLDDGRMLILARREAGSRNAALLAAPPPYTDFTAAEVDRRLGGPQLIRLPDGRLLTAGRIHPEQGSRTALLWLDPPSKQLREFLVLPSGGDNSYPGLVHEDGEILVSYYSSHEGKSAIYFTRIRLPRP